MDVTLDQCQKLVSDAQIAHRLLVAYYERLMARLDMIAGQLEASFLRWDPTETDRPCRSKTPPSRNWLWDMIPLYAAYYAYGKTSASTIRKGDFAVCFMVYTDDAFDSENRKNAGLRGRPDPLTMPSGEGSIVVDIYVAGRSLKKTWDVLWDDLEDPVPDNGTWSEVGNEVVARAFHVPLAEFMHQPDALGSRISALIAERATATS